ncbi:MAG TPA: hypothetical protein VK614_13060 [Allosphingosinicella sp.]|nr:hypothetical protein [Allosphingosinicella sp.]
MPGAGRAANLAVGLAGLVLIALALAAGPGWVDRHFLPTFAWSRSFQIGLIQALRAILAAFGLTVILFARPRVARAVAGGRGRALLISAVSASLAVIAAFAAAEAVLHTRAWHANQERWGDREPLRQRDALLGWTFVPNHLGRRMVEGRRIDYVTDAFGYRVRAPRAELDFDRPTVVFAGESIMFGYRLPWRETIPARVEARTGIQTANLAVNAFATDQAFLRLRRELPRFRRPVAVVIPFVPMLFDRNLDEDRPHLDGSLDWHPGRPPPLRLVELARRVLRYRSEESIARGVATTQAVLRATIALARSRGAATLIVVPQFQPEDPSERAIRRRVLDAAHLPYLLVPLDPGWRLAVDRHPDARGAEAIAAAIARALAARVGS